MALKIRLSRAGAKKRPFYRIVIADARAPRDGRFIEKVGTFNPLLPKDHKDRLVVQEDRIKYWLSVGGKPTDRVARFLSEIGLVEKPAIPEQTKKCKPKAKAMERMEEAKAAAEEAKAAAEEAKASEAEA
ncbi:MAG: 30S ribosomal protein S16 [Alphaproteobacteria bacterium]|nr:30S ribosomal protein S16 [Alphaproteobacteria bacterium]